jgi:outer membrane protein assembly factor BamB
VFVVGGLVWVTDFKTGLVLGLDPRSGEVKRKISNRKAFDNGHHHRCYRNKATVRHMIASFRGLEFVDWASGDTNRNHWVRGTCRLGVVPCNGMIYATPHPCDCYITSKLNGMLALGPAAKGKPPEETVPRLKKGPAYGALTTDNSPLATASDWPTYRRDPQRSGATAAAAPARLDVLWQVDLGGMPTSPVVAGGCAVVACKPSREVVSLDAATGREQWRFVAGGPLDTPPTLGRGRVVFGCTDGHVYCLRATDGALAWRFRAAPRRRLVGAFGGVESAWPVHGSVLVVDDTVYCTAGRSSFLDGGIHAFALKLATGEVVAKETIASPHDMDVGWGRDQTVDTGVLSDLLVAHEGGVYLRQRPVLGKGTRRRLARHLHATSGMLDSSWFHRTRWFLGGAAVAEYLVFRGRRVCGVRARKGIGGYGLHFAPGQKGFELFAADLPPEGKPLAPVPPRRPSPKVIPRRRGGRGTPKRPKPVDVWSVRVPVRVTAMVLAGETLLAAGTPDVVGPDGKDPWAAYEGRRGGKLLVLSAADGKITARLDLAGAPVLDGLAAAGGRVYLSTADGKLTCYGAK